MKRFELAWFEGLDVEKALKVISNQPGVVRPRKARALGWRNQPYIVRFSGTDETRGHVQHAMSQYFDCPFFIVRELTK